MVQNTKIRILEVSLVLGVAFLPAILLSVFALFSDSFTAFSSAPDAMHLRYFFTGVEEVLALCVLLYVLFRQRRSLQDIGLTWEWKDLWRSMCLIVLVYLALMIVGAIVASFFTSSEWILDMQERTQFLLVSLSLGMIAFLAVNAFFEELIVRAYFMTELSALTKKPVIAVLASTLLQSSYHLYQGWQSAALLSVVFFIFSLYFIKYKRITPIIIAHFTIDFITFLVRQ